MPPRSALRTTAPTRVSASPAATPDLAPVPTPVGPPALAAIDGNSATPQSPTAGNTAGLAAAAAPAIGTAAEPGTPSRSGGPATPDTSDTESGAPDPAEPATAQPDGADGDAGGSDAIRILGASLPSQAGQALASARNSADSEITQDRTALAGNPPAMQAPSGLTPTSAAVGEPGAALPEDANTAAPGIDDQAGTGAEPTAADTTHQAAQGPVPTGPAPDAVVAAAPQDPVARVAAFRHSLARMPVSDGNIITDPGPAPEVALTGEADPGRIDQQAARTDVSVTAEQATAARGMQEDAGVDLIFPTLPDERLVASTSGGTTSMPPVAEFENPSLSPAVMAGFDQGVGPLWRAETSRAAADHQTALLQRQTSETEERAATAHNIADLDVAATAEQRGLRQTAQTEVAAARVGWQSELDTADGTYRGESGRISRDLDRDVDARVTLADDQATTHLDTGHDRAEERRLATESEAERRRREADNQRQQADGFFDWISSRVKSFFRRLQEGLKTLFDGLRRVVATIIEGAKRLAAAAIELGRRAVIGLIRIAGAALELAADVLLAAFPAARDRAKALIRAGVERAEDGVNRAAEALRRGVFALLDALGTVLTFILDVYEAFYSALFSVFEFLIVGYIEVQRALFRLDLAAKFSPGEFEGQIYEEMLGADLTQPLAFEATASEIADWEAQVASATGGGGADPVAALDAGGLPTSVQADSVASFDPDPELLQSLNFGGGNVIEFGENNDPSNTLSALYDETITEGDGAANGGDVQGGGAPQMGDGSPGSAVPGTTTDEKLDHFINQPGPTECRTETPTQTQGPAIPLVGKIGPLTKSQRARYMLNQAWTGIQHWASCNWPWIVAGILAALIVIAAIVAVVVLSGGTVGAALGGLLTVFTGAMIIYAIARVGGFLLDYLRKSIDGDTIGGAKALARSVAVGAVEIIFAVLTYLTAGAFRAVAAGIKGMGRLAVGAARGAGQVARATGRGVRRVSGATRTGLRAVTRATGRVGSAFMRRGRLVIRGVRRGFERGAKSLRDLGRRLGRWFRFRRFKIERRGNWFQLYGLINPWVLLASGDIRRIDDLGDVDVGTRVSLPGRSQPGIVVGIKTRSGGGRAAASAADFDSTAVAALRGQSKHARTQFHKAHRGSTPAQIRAALDVSGETARNSRILANSMKNTPRSGRPKPSPAGGDHAHHLVPSTDARGAVARRILQRFGVDINDAANGMFLNASKHARMHTNAGYQRINNMLAGASSQSDALRILDDIAALIAKNKFP